eukprot:350211-Chlamydomonas_euryale.AAC.5
MHQTDGGGVRCAVLMARPYRPDSRAGPFHSLCRAAAGVRVHGAAADATATAGHVVSLISEACAVRAALVRVRSSPDVVVRVVSDRTGCCAGKHRWRRGSRHAARRCDLK